MDETKGSIFVIFIFKPKTIHDRTQVFLGNTEEVEELHKYIKGTIKSWKCKKNHRLPRKFINRPLGDGLSNTESAFEINKPNSSIYQK